MQATRTLMLSLIALGLGCAQRPTLIEPKATLYSLAADDMEGRGLDGAGIDRAAELIRNKFEAIGLQPVTGMHSSYQPFEVVWSSQVAGGSTLAVGDKTYKLNEDFVPTTLSAEGAIKGSVVFVGYGITSAENAYDDFAGMDVKGKVVLMMRFEPHDAEGKSRFDPEKKQLSAASALRNKVKTAVEKGAAAVLIVNPPKFHGDDDRLMRFIRNFGEEASSVPVVQIKQAVAEELLKRGSVRDLKTLQASIDESGKPASAELDAVTVAGQIHLQRNTKPAKNVMAMLPGRGPNASEFVVVGAHYDHLGRGGMMGHAIPGATTRSTTAPASGPAPIFNGADDNASGVTAMLAIAEKLSRQGPQSRSILFVAFSGEEMGLLGSAHFVKEPPIALDRIVAMLNLDMVGRVRDEKLLVGGGGTAAAFKSILHDADVHSPLEIQSIGDSGIGPSDHTSFAVKKIPVLFFFTGTHPDYHRPTDDAERINYVGLQQVIDLSVDVVKAMTRMPRQPYNSAADKDAIKIPGQSSGARVTLGVIPDYGTDVTSGGVKISGTVPDSPAAAAGLKENDLLVGFGARKIESLMDLTEALAVSKPDEVVKLKVIRNGKPIELQATLRAKQ
jgi:Zn-dependent M28 family amino/carboxypeptidase